MGVFISPFLRFYILGHTRLGTIELYVTVLNVKGHLPMTTGEVVTVCMNNNCGFLHTYSSNSINFFVNSIKNLFPRLLTCRSRDFYRLSF